MNNWCNKFTCCYRRNTLLEININFLRPTLWITVYLQILCIENRQQGNCVIKLY